LHVSLSRLEFNGQLVTGKVTGEGEAATVGGNGLSIPRGNGARGRGDPGDRTGVQHPVKCLAYGDDVDVLLSQNFVQPLEISGADWVGCSGILGQGVYDPPGMHVDTEGCSGARVMIIEVPHEEFLRLGGSGWCQLTSVYEGTWVAILSQQIYKRVDPESGEGVGRAWCNLAVLDTVEVGGVGPKNGTETSGWPGAFIHNAIFGESLVHGIPTALEEWSAEALDV